MSRMDRISELPDDLLLNILSSLFFKDVVATSVLSRRWQFLWKLVAKLKIGHNEYSSFSCANLFSSSLARSNPQLLKSLDIQLIPGDNDIRISPWVDPAVYCGLRELRIEFLYRLLELPSSLLSCGTLETLTLCRLQFVDVPPRASLSLPSLKTLRLLSVKFSRDKSVQRLLSSCPVLEDLVVSRSAYSSVEVFTINVPTLKSLSIRYLRVGAQPAGIHGFVINAPSLRYLNIRDRYSNHLLFTNMPELIKANVEAVSDRSQSLIGSLASVQHLSLCSKSLNLQIPYHAGTFFAYLEHVELCTCSSEWWNLLAHILINAPRLQVLKLKSIHCIH